MTNNSDYLFDKIHIDEKGKFIGKIKGENKHYIIDIAVNCKTHTTSESNENIVMHLTEQDNTISEEMTFERADGITLSFSFNNNALYLSNYKNDNHEINYREYNYKVKLLKGYNILSIKKTRNVLQLETIHNKKKRILYLDPEKLALPKMRAKCLSHKPPQDTHSAMGADPHEFYDSGQPFSSSRLGNFSSKNIPFFSNAIDNFRMRFQKSKMLINERKPGKAMYEMLNAIDPGIRAIILTARGKPVMRMPQGKDKNISEIIHALDSKCISLIKRLPTTVINKKDIDASFSDLLKKLKNGERISLSKSKNISFFCGIAKGGVPFVPGFFVGFVGALSKKSSITFNKQDENNISCTLDKNFSTLGAFLAGTGQGLEKTLLRTDNIDYLTLLPLESNLIYLLQSNKNKGLTFDINEEELSEFISNSRNKTNLLNFIDKIKNRVSINKKSEYLNKLSIEARALELRLQLGKSYDPGNYVVAPRGTAGLMLTTDILSVKHIQETNIDVDGNEITNKKTELELCATHAKIVTERKIMPIVSTQINSENYYCPIPIIEESGNKRIINTRPYLRKFRQHNDDDPLIETTLSNTIKSLNATDMNINKTHGISCLTNLDMTYNTEKNIKSPLLKKKSQSIKNINIHKNFIDSLKKIQSELLSKERKNLGKSMAYYITTDYILSEKSKADKEIIEKEIKAMQDSEATFSKEQIHKLIDAFDCKIKEFKKNAIYSLSQINIISINSLYQSTSTLPNLVFYLNQRNDLEQTKSLGSITFEYTEENPAQPYKVTSDLNMIE